MSVDCTDSRPLALRGDPVGSVESVGDQHVDDDEVLDQHHGPQGHAAQVDWVEDRSAE
jgi:hypothetical protein